MTRAASSDPTLLSVTDRVREVAAVLLFGVAAFVLLACASYVDPQPGVTLGRFANLCGRTGLTIAETALFWFGYGVYLGLVILFTWALSLFARRSVHMGPFRLLWLASFLFAISAFLSHAVDGASARLPDPGGLVGFEIARFFDEVIQFGPWGTTLVLLILVVVTFQLATDFVLFTLVAAGARFVVERRAQAAELLKATGPLFTSLFRERAARAALDAPEAAGARRRSRSRKRAEAGDGADGGETDGADADADGADGDEAADGRASRKKSRKRRAKDDAEIAVADEEVVGFAGGASKRDADAGDTDDAVELDGDGAAGVAAAGGRGPRMLDEDRDSEVDPEAARAKRKSQAKIHYEPPPKAHGAGGAAAFDKEHVVYAPPPMPAEKVEYTFPSLDLLEATVPVPATEFQRMIEHNVEVLESALASYKIEAEVEEIQKGPVITMFELQVAAGTRVDRIRALEDDLAIRMKAQSVRIVAPIPGKSTIGIEVPNSIRESVRMRDLLESPAYQSEKFAIPVFLGKDAAGRVLIEDLAKMPHMLVAGATGAGKSVCLNATIISILYTRTPDQVKMIMIDPKMVELSSFEHIPHLMCPVVRDMNKAAQILEWACAKMDERYELLAEAGARNIFAFNKIPEDKLRERLHVPPDDDAFEPRMPFIVIVVDELADLMMVGTKEVEHHITRLAQKSRAVGIHVILATQRPSTNVITGLIKANMPTRISFQVTSKVDSRVVLDQNGAEKLLGSGDMLYMPPRTSMLQRAQGTYVSDEEIHAVVEAVKTNAPMYAPELVQKKSRSETDPREIDALYDEAAKFVCESQRGSASLLQRRFAIGYTRASRLIDLMAEDGILGEYRNSQAREVVLTLDDYETRQAGRDAGAGGETRDALEDLDTRDRDPLDPDD